MGVFSEIDMDMSVNANGSVATMAPMEQAAPVRQAVISASAAPVQNSTASSASDDAKKKAADEAAAKRKADEDAKRKAHEESEAKRKAEWQANKAARKAAEKEQLARLSIMSDDEVMMASVKRVAADTEKLTRRNMKEFVSEHIQTKCLDDPDFARRTMHPRKSMIHCIWYINRKAKEYLLKEMELNGQKPEGNGIYGGDVPDDLCYQWAEDYYNDPNAEEDKVKEEKFVPKPYNGKSTPKKSDTSEKTATEKKVTAQQGMPKKPVSMTNADLGQMTMGDFGPVKESA